jgi:hypothetical protein
MFRIILSVVLFTAMTFSAQAQRYGWYSHLNYIKPDLGLAEGKAEDILSRAKVVRVEITHVKVNGSRERLLEGDIYSIDGDGYATEHARHNHQGKLDYQTNLGFDIEHQPISRTSSNRKGNTTQTVTQKYNELGLVTDYMVFNQKDKLVWNKNTTYLDSQMLTSKTYRAGKLDKHWEYAYYENGDRSQTTLFNQRGKVKFLWQYECNDEGVEVEKHKDTTTVCIEKSTDALGNRKEVYLTTGSRGKTRQTITVYNQANKIVSLKRQSPYGKYESSYQYTYVSDTVLISEGYKGYKRGILRHSTGTAYNLKGEIVSKRIEIMRRGKTKFHEELVYVFDDNGLLVKREIRYPNDKKPLKYIQRVDYVKSNE